MTRAACLRIAIGLALAGAMCQSAVSALQARPAFALTSPASPNASGGAGDGCVYASTDYVAPTGERYEMQHFGPAEAGFYYHYDPGAPAAPPDRERRKLVVLVAGLPDAHYFDALRAQLLNSDYRVLILDLPGKRHTRLTGRPTANYIVDQYEQLWRALAFSGETQPLIVGTSIGGPVAASMAVRLVSQRPTVALVSAVGLPHDYGFGGTLAGIPILSDFLAPFTFPAFVERQWEASEKGELLCPRRFPQLFERQDQEFRGGFARINYLELSRALALTDQTAVYHDLGKTSIPVLLAYGSKDPFSDQCSLIRRTIGRPVDIKQIELSAHIAFVEQPVTTFGTLETFLRDPSPGLAEQPFCSDQVILATPSS